MGQAGAAASGIRCCNDELANARCPVELDVDALASRSGGPPNAAANGGQELCTVHQLHWQIGPRQAADAGVFKSVQFQEGKQWGCCKATAGEVEAIAGHTQALESLSYLPVHFEEDSTVDTDRSHARYSKILVHSTRHKPRRSKVWEDWLRSASGGRAITLLQGLCQAVESREPSGLERIPAIYSLDRVGSKLSILPAQGVDVPAMPILLDAIQVICSAADFMSFFDRADALLDDAEKRRAVLLQYLAEDGARTRVCFLEDSEASQERCVQALTALWLERRGDLSTWF